MRLRRLPLRRWRLKRAGARSLTGRKIAGAFAVAFAITFASKAAFAVVGRLSSHGGGLGCDDLCQGRGTISVVIAAGSGSCSVASACCASSLACSLSLRPGLHFFICRSPGC